jgi:phage major head subunit gpT-like protein
MSEPIKLNRTNFGELLTPVHRKVFFDEYEAKPKQYVNVFKTETSNKKQETFPHLGAFGTWAENTEGSDFNFDDMAEGDIATFTARRFDKSYEITWELMQDDQYNVMKGAGKGGSAQKLAKGLAATEETDAASVISGGFDNVGYDGVSLFDEAHPLINSEKTCDNLATGGLTDVNLKAALTKMRLQVDEAGVLVAAHANRLVVCPEWEFAARALINSSLQAGTANNDTNTLPSLEIVVWDYLNDATGATKPWFIQDSSMDNLLFLWREKPIFDSEKISNKMDYRFYGYCRFDTGYVDWRGLVGSTGVTAG